MRYLQQCHQTTGSMNLSKEQRVLFLDTGSTNSQNKRCQCGCVKASKDVCSSLGKYQIRCLGYQCVLVLLSFKATPALSVLPSVD
jgi:hypothetical protein